MKIDTTYGKTGFWIKGKFYSLRKGLKPKDQINVWKRNISRLSRSIVNIKSDIEKIKINGYAYGDPNIKIEKLEQLIIHHNNEIKHHKSLIDNIKDEIPLQEHAKQMIKDGIDEDDYNG